MWCLRATWSFRPILTLTHGPHPAIAPDVVFTARFILFGLVLAQLADAFTFTLGVSRFGIGLESNGIATAMYQASGLDGVLVMKAGVLLVTLALLVATAHRLRRLFVWGGATATSFGLLGFVANTTSILLLS
jgi:hypothetical protein